MRMRSRAEGSWMSKGKLQKELREVEKFSCVPKEAQESRKSILQQQLQEVERRRHHLLPEHQEAQERSQRIESIQDKRRNLQEESTAAEEEMQRIKEEINRNEERFLQLSNKVEKNKRADAEKAAELPRLQCFASG